jgi:exodeoxyribonuclease-5
MSSISEIVKPKGDEKALNEGQEKVKGRIEKWLKNPQPGSFLLNALAGTGKTFTVSRTLDSRKMFIAAPTHRALNEFRKNVPCLNFATTHSLLSAQPVVNVETGDLEFITGEGRELDETYTLIIDEAGMLSGEHLDKIEKLYSNYKRLYLGDSEQLPPVKEQESRVFKIKHQAYGELTEIVRYSGDILHYATGILNDYFEAPNSLLNREMSRQWKSVLRSGIECKLLAFTNKAVDEWNTEARATINGIDQSEKYDWLDDDPIILKAPIKPEYADEPTLFHTNETGRLYNVGEDKYTIDKTTFPIYTASIHFPEVGESLHDRRLMSHEISLAFEEWKKHIVEGVKEGKFENPRKAWAKYYKALDDFVQCKHNYASTVHSTQGATINTVFVDVKNIAICKNKKMKKALLYTGITRAGEMLVVNG